MNGITRGMLLVLTLCLGCHEATTGQMTSQQYAAISKGMSEDEVRGIAGSPDLIQENAKFPSGVLGASLLHPKVGTIWYYNDADSTTGGARYIYFQSGRVALKESD